MQSRNKKNQEKYIDLLKYTPECSYHGYMKQVRQTGNIHKWECINKKCGEFKFGLNSYKLLEIISDSQSLDIETINILDFEKSLTYFTQISQIKFATLISVLFENKLTLTDNWLINLAEIENLIEKRIRTELNEKLVQAKLERSLIERSKSNFRICLLCGTSNCKTINSCMVTSD